MLLMHPPHAAMDAMHEWGRNLDDRRKEQGTCPLQLPSILVRSIAPLNVILRDRSGHGKREKLNQTHGYWKHQKLKVPLALYVFIDTSFQRRINIAYSGGVGNGCQSRSPAGLVYPGNSYSQ